MNRRLNLAGNTSAVAFLVSSIFFMTGLVWAQAISKAAGELVSAGQATINGSSAISGLTVFSNNRIRTAQEGAAVVNFGKYGRLRLGADTDFTLRFSSAQIGGELHTGRAVVSAPLGVALSVSTARGVVTSDGRQSTALTIEIDSKHARVIAHRGEARLVSGVIVERIEEGDEIVLEPSLGRWQHGLVATGSQEPRNFANGSRPAGWVGGPRTATSRELIPTITELINAGINYSMGQLMAGKDRNTDQFYNTTITCRNHYTTQCRRRGRFSP
jgi:hypothetical protein